MTCGTEKVVRVIGGLTKHVFSACLRKLQAATMVCQQIDPLAGAFYQKRRPRLPGMEQSLLRLLIFTLHLVLVRCGIMFHSTHPIQSTGALRIALARRSASSLSMVRLLLTTSLFCL